MEAETGTTVSMTGTGHIQVVDAMPGNVTTTMQGPHGRQVLMVGGSGLVDMSGITFVPPKGGDALHLAVAMYKRLGRVIQIEIEHRDSQIAEAKRRSEVLETSVQGLDTDDYSQVDGYEEPSVTLPDDQLPDGVGIRDVAETGAD